MADEKVQNQDNQQPTTPPPSPSGPNGLGLLAQVTNLAWDLVIPIVGGVLLGHYIDTRRGDGITWTLSLLTLGLLVAFINLYELHNEQKHHQKEKNHRDNRKSELNHEEK